MDTRLREWAREHVTIEERGDVWQMFFGETFVDERDNYHDAAQSRDFYVDLFTKAGESLIRQCAEIATLPDDEFKRRFPDIWELWMHDDISSERAINMAILREFGLDGKEEKS